MLYISIESFPFYLPLNLMLLGFPFDLVESFAESQLITLQPKYSRDFNFDFDFNQSCRNLFALR